MDDKKLYNYIDNLLTKKGVNVSPEVREQLIDDMVQRVLDIIDREVIAVMSDSDVTKLNELLDNNSPDEEVQSHIAKSVPHMEEIVATTLRRFSAAYLGGGDIRE